MVPMTTNRLEVTDNVMKKKRIAKEMIFALLNPRKASPTAITTRKSEYNNPGSKIVVATGIWLNTDFRSIKIYDPIVFQVLAT